MATKNTSKIVVPAMVDASVPATVVEAEVVTVPATMENAPSEVVNDAPSEAATVPATMFDAKTVKAYDPATVDATIAELQENWKVFQRALDSGKIKDVTSYKDVFGLGDSLESDILKAKIDAGGNVATIIDALKSDDLDVWAKVTEYDAILSALEVVNDLRSHLGLPSMSIVYGGKTKGNASTLKAVIHPKRTSGFMRIGVVDGEYSGAKVHFDVTAERITVTVNKMQVYSGEQGAVSVSVIMNDYVLPACGSSGRVSAPKWFNDNGYDPNEIMINAKPTSVGTKTM